MDKVLLKEIDQSNKEQLYYKRLMTLQRRLQRVEAARNYLINNVTIVDYDKKKKLLDNLIKELEMRIYMLEKEKYEQLFSRSGNTNINFILELISIIF